MVARPRLARSLLAGSLALLALAACSSSKHASATSTTAASGGATSSTSTAPAATTGTSASTSSTAPATAGCTSGTGTPPAGAHTKPTVDVDGDGKPDTAWMTPPDGSGTVRFGISTAAGGGASIPFSSASPVERVALVVNVDQRGPVEIILSDGRGASLHAFSGCAIEVVRNPQGRPYTFDLGDRIGTGSGIGCAQTLAGRRLVGFNITQPSGPTTSWTRTVIDLNELQARNGAITSGTYQAPADQAKIDQLSDITCGTLTIHHDGVSSGP